MTSLNGHSAGRLLHGCVAAAGLLAVATQATAQPLPDQFLLVSFSVVSVAVPLSGWLIAGIAVVLAATAMAALRRNRPGGGRLFGWMLVLIAGGTLLAATGQRIVSDARAGADPSVINLTVSPGSLALKQYDDAQMDEVTVTVNNETGRAVVITRIALDTPGAQYFTIDPKGSTCSEGLQLAPGQSCTIRLFSEV